MPALDFFFFCYFSPAVSNPNSSKSNQHRELKPQETIVSKENIKIMNAALDDVEGDIILRGVVDPGSLNLLKAVLFVTPAISILPAIV